MQRVQSRRTQNVATSKELLELAGLTPDAAIARLGSSREGLSEATAEARLEQYGINEVAHEHHKSAVRRLLELFFTPRSVLLLGLATVNYFTGVQFSGLWSTELKVRSPFGERPLCAESRDCNGSFTPIGTEAPTGGSTVYTCHSHLDDSCALRSGHSVESRQRRQSATTSRPAAPLKLLGSGH